MAREKCGLLAVPNTVPVWRDALPYTAHVHPSVYSRVKRIHAAISVSTVVSVQLIVSSCKNAFCVFPRGIL